MQQIKPENSEKFEFEGRDRPYNIAPLGTFGP